MRSRSILFTPARAAALAFLAHVAIASPTLAEVSTFATGVAVKPVDDSLAREVIVQFSSPPQFTARWEKDRTRLVVDVPGGQVRGAPGAITQREGVVAGVMTQGFERDGKHTYRILVTLRDKARYSITARGSDLVLAFSPSTSDNPGAAGAHATTAVAPSVAAITKVSYEPNSVVERVVVAASATPEYTLQTRPDGGTRWLLRGASLPPTLARILDVSAFAGSVTHIASYVDPAAPNQVVVDVDHSPQIDHRVVRDGTDLVLELYKPGTLPSSMTGIARDGGVARRIRTVGTELPLPAETALAGAEPSTVSTPDERAQAVTSSLFGQLRGERFAGRRIDLDLKDADIHNVLRLLADVGRVNVVTADNVSGTVTIRMRNVPWDQALEVILQSKKLGMVRQANMIRVAPQDELDKERELAVKRARAEAEVAPVETRLIPVSYAQADEIQQRAKDLLSERGSIAVDKRTNVMVVRDVAGNLNQIEELTRALDTQTPQVLVEARIVEATSRYLRDVGIQWGGDATFSPATGNPTGLAFPNAVGIAGGATDSNAPTAGLSPVSNQVQNPNFAVNLPAAVGTGQGGAIGLTFGSIDNTINLAVRLSAAEATGMLRILSSPRILTLDNSSARIAQGTLIPFSQVSAQGVQTTFQEAKLQLLVTPHVTAEGSVSMTVKINRDEPDFNQTSARGDPTILKREAETELLVMDGHTAVIGGIYTRNTGRNLDQVPFFGDIPILGLLFQRRRASDSRGELVIFLTPRIVNRAEALGR